MTAAKKNEPLECDFYDVADLRKLLGLGRDQVYRMLDEGTIPSVRFGTQYRVLKSDYETWKAGLTRHRQHLQTIPFPAPSPSGRGQRTPR